MRLEYIFIQSAVQWSVCIGSAARVWLIVLIAWDAVRAQPFVRDLWNGTAAPAWKACLHATMLFILISTIAVMLAHLCRMSCLLLGFYETLSLLAGRWAQPCWQKSSQQLQLMMKFKMRWWLTVMMTDVWWLTFMSLPAHPKACLCPPTCCCCGPCQVKILSSSEGNRNNTFNL